MLMIVVTSDGIPLKGGDGVCLPVGLAMAAWTINQCVNVKFHIAIYLIVSGIHTHNIP